MPFASFFVIIKPVQKLIVCIDVNNPLLVASVKKVVIEKGGNAPEFVRILRDDANVQSLEIARQRYNSYGWISLKVGRYYHKFMKPKWVKNRYLYRLENNMLQNMHQNSSNLCG